MWICCGFIFFGVFTLWSFFTWAGWCIDRTQNYYRPDIDLISKVIFGVSGQICGLLLILIGKVANCARDLSAISNHAHAQTVSSSPCLSGGAVSPAATLPPS